MKNKFFLVLICLLLSGCDILYPLSVYNTSEYPVTILSQEFSSIEATYNPQHAEHPGWSYQTAFPGERVVIESWERWPFEASIQDSGYIKIFIMDTSSQRDTLCIYYMEEWSIKKSCNVIFFPPNKLMRDFKMWPPYGTYDANGHRVEQ